MILNRKDIETIARARFGRSNSKEFIGMVLVFVLILTGLNFLVLAIPKPFDVVTVIAVALGFFSWMVSLFLRQKKYIEKFIEEVRNEGTHFSE